MMSYRPLLLELSITTALKRPGVFVRTDLKMAEDIKTKLEAYRTAPFDARFPNQNQTRNCWSNYLGKAARQGQRSQLPSARKSNFSDCLNFYQSLKKG